MRILVLSPQPFFQERGTPIAVRLAVEALSKRLGSPNHNAPSIDLLVYNEGENIQIPGVRIIRNPTPRFLQGVRPGISLKKLLCDVVLFAYTLWVLWQNRRSQYNLIHAVEESVFIAWIAKLIFRTPYIYDMDSSLALQLTEKWWWCKPLLFLLQYLEGIAIRGSISVAPVCDALQEIATKQGSRSTVMLRDVSLLPASKSHLTDRSLIFGQKIKDSDAIILYVGNLESYQGIDLLLSAFARIAPKSCHTKLIIVGGTQITIEKYQKEVAELGCEEQVVFVGPRPITTLSSLLGAADILVSPRISGNNTPMKIYSYLHSGTALLATDLPTHRQVLNDSISLLAPPDTLGFGDAMLMLINTPQLRRQLGDNARRVAEELYTVEAFEAQIGALYEGVSRLLGVQLNQSSSALEII